jgi:hypothetical protein
VKVKPELVTGSNFFVTGRFLPTVGDLIAKVKN